MNTEGGEDHYPLRVKGITAELHRDQPTQLGLVGLQEVKKQMERCLFSPARDSGVACFARAMAAAYDAPAASARKGPLGIVAGDDWRLLAEQGWTLGKDSLLKIS